LLDHEGWPQLPPIDTAPRLRPPEQTVGQDWARLAQYLAAAGFRLSLSPPPRQFAGGLANLNYLLMLDGRQAVLRRPPMGTLPIGAYDMAREFRIVSRLARGFKLVPQGIHLCEDSAVIGAPFQILEFRPGFSVRETLPEALCGQPLVARQLSAIVIDVLADLHAVDPASIDLAELGRPQGFLERTIEGWSRRGLTATAGSGSERSARLIPELSDWLRKHRVPEGQIALLHNDLKLDNILLDGTDLHPVAVLDWDQCTRGDVLFDLATTLSYWTESTDPPVMHALAQMPTAAAGFPTRLQAAQAYARLTGADLSDFRFHRVLAIFKLAVIFHQLHARSRQGATADPRYARFGNLADDILEFAQLVAHGSIF